MNDDDPGIPLSPRSHLYALLDSALVLGVREVVLGDYPDNLFRDVIVYVETNRTTANELGLILVAGHFVVTVNRVPVLTVKRPAVAKEAA
jgi:hypothetical protein